MKKAMRCFLSAAILIFVSFHFSNGGSQQKTYVTPDGSRPSGLFAPGVLVGKTLYISGKGDYKPDEGIPGKTRNCLTEIRNVLKQAGMDMENVVQVWVYLEDINAYSEMNKAYAEFFPTDPPARTTLGVNQVPGESQMEMTVIAYRDLRERKVIGRPAAGLPFSPGVLAGTTLYISGKGDQLPDGTHPATFEEQVRQALKNVGTVLQAAGLDFRHVVMAHMYLDSIDYYSLANKVYSEFFEFGNEPARATVFVDHIPGGSHVEMTCLATTDLPNRKVVRPPSMKYGLNETAPTASPGVWAGDTLYLSAQTGFMPGEGVVSDSLETQFRQMVRNQQDVIVAAGLGWKDLVSGNVYLRDINDYAPMNELYREYFAAEPGVRTTLQPNSGYEKNNARVRASFIFARPNR
jgi:enamine deaminase RidA (YjgF/YER057c/UK114 family)